jgi:hypothetical protein
MFYFVLFVAFAIYNNSVDYSSFAKVDNDKNMDSNKFAVINLYNLLNHYHNLDLLHILSVGKN